MVLIHVKANEDDGLQFLYECNCCVAVDELADAVLEIANLQSAVRTLSSLCRRRLSFSPQASLSSGDVVTAGMIHGGLPAPLDRALSEAGSYASKEQVLHKRVISRLILKDHIDRISREVELARSFGFPDLDLPDLSSETGGVQLWWAGRELVMGKKLSDYIGENEKTKIFVKLKQSSSS